MRCLLFIIQSDNIDILKFYLLWSFIMKLKLFQRVFKLNVSEQDLYEGDIRKPIEIVVNSDNIQELQDLVDRSEAFLSYKEAYRETMRIVIKGYKLHHPDTPPRV